MPPVPPETALAPPYPEPSSSLLLHAAKARHRAESESATVLLEMAMVSPLGRQDRCASGVGRLRQARDAHNNEQHNPTRPLRIPAGAFLSQEPDISGTDGRELAVQPQDSRYMISEPVVYRDSSEAKSSCLTIVEVEHTTKPLAAADGPRPVAVGRRLFEQSVPHTLVVPFLVIMGQVLGN
ncbi:hypothetical protein ACFL5O_02665 [Myxococcota bacterium]